MTGRIASAALAVGVLLLTAGCAGTPAARVVQSPARTAAARPSSAVEPGATGTVTFTATTSPAPSAASAPTTPDTTSPAAGSDSATPVSTPDADGASSPPASPAAVAAVGYPGLQGSIGFGRIGGLTTSMTIQQIKSALRSPVRIEYGDPQCLGQTFGGASGDQGGADALIVALAMQHGDHGPVDVLLMGTGWGAHDPSAAVLRRLPRTAKGIGLGSPVAAVTAAYPDALFGSGANGDGRRAAITDGHGRSMVFIAAGSGKTVTMIGTGVERLTPADDGCG